MIALGVAPAAAATNRFHFTYDEITTETQCGFAVERHYVGKGTGHTTTRSFNLINDGVATYTNLANGLSVKLKYRLIFKNGNQVENGDGTVTSIQTTVGRSTLHGSNGQVLLYDHGPTKTRIVINPNAENDEDFFVSEEILFQRGPHGDFCQALTAAIGPDAD